MIPAESTSFIHDGVTMTEYKNEPFIVGDYNHNEIEFMHLSHELWYTAPPFPYRDQVFGYTPVSRPGKVFILGGCCDDNKRSNRIFLYENDNFTEMANQLKYGRANFMTITYGTDVIIFGGKIEKWNCQKCGQYESDLY